MSSLAKPKDLSKYPYEITLQGCPAELFKSVQSLQTMGMISTVFQLSFKTINELEIFAQILNREEDEERIANELKVTYFHNVRGKIKKTQLAKNQEFNAMRKVRFNSTYHVTLFLKYYQDRIKQLENQYMYTITSGREGYLYVYMNDEDNISSMFINQIRDMKKRLNFLQIKDVELCERFIYSEKLGSQLNKIGVFHQIWYRGKDSTMIFYSQKQTLLKMKQLIQQINRVHVTIMRMSDRKLAFLVNYFLFLLLKKSFWPDIRKLGTVQMSQLQFNENKVGVVIHDMHQIFTVDIKTQLLQNMKNFVLFNFRAKFGRGYFNWLKKNYYFDESVNFSYSKKTVCMCINLLKIKSYEDLKKIFSALTQSMNGKSVLTFNWFHLQDPSLYEYRKQLIQRIINVVEGSIFYVQNFHVMPHYKQLKCVLKPKNSQFEVNILSQKVSQVLANVVVAWKDNKKIIKQTQKQQKISEQSPQVYNFDQKIAQDQVQGDDQDSDSQQSQYDAQQFTDVIATANQDQEDKPKVQPVRLGFKQQNNFTDALFNHFKENQFKYFEQSLDDQITDWKIQKSWRKVEEQLLSQTKIYTRIKKIQLNLSLKQKFNDVLEKLRDCSESVYLYFHNQDSYSPTKYESPFYKPENQEEVSFFSDLKVGSKYVVCCEIKQKDTMYSYPLCSLEVMKRF